MRRVGKISDFPTTSRPIVSETVQDVVKIAIDC